MKIKKAVCVCVLFFITTLVFTENAAELRKNVIDSAKSYLGVPYAWGGGSRSGMDCSGLVATAVKEGSGISLPRTVESIFNYVDMIPFSKAEAGDLLFFKDGTTVTHVAIFIGGDDFIHSASDGPETGVIISDLEERYWKTYFFATGSFLDSTGGFFNVQASEKESTTQSNDDFFNERPLSTSSGISFAYVNDNIIGLDIDATMSYLLFNKTRYIYSNDNLSLNAFLKMKILLDQFQVGGGIGILVPNMSQNSKIPFFVTIGFPFGFSIDVGSYFLYERASLAESLCGGGGDRYYWEDNPAGFVSLGWQTPSLMIEEVAFSLVQNILWAGEFKHEGFSPYENFIHELSYSIGLRVGLGV